MAAPLVTRDPEGFTVVHGDERFEGLAFAEATWVAKAAATGDQVFPCGWLIEALVDDFDGAHVAIIECGAPAVGTDRGFTCSVGHGHVNMETRSNEGWDY